PSAPRETAPADATAFAPKKLRRGTPELVRVVIHQPSQARDVIKAAKKIDPYARPAPQGISIGDIALGANVGIALQVHGASCDGVVQRRSWAGEPIDFAFPIEPDSDAKQAVFVARVFVDDAQIGVIAFTRQIIGATSQAPTQEIRLTRHKRVFISYSSADRETVSVIATAYEMAGVEHFWDRTALKSGEEWSPRLKKEIERADLFHLCWSKAAAQSEWVAKEAAHALKRRRSAKRPEITVQMLDGPPWAPHPPELDSINFDDFVRAAIAGYARGET
nr:toll/interleukin-1 receptor domain-containing protein [Terricaulis sp.]